MKRFIQELQKRGVFRAAGLYAAIVWLLLQVSDVLFPAFDIPDSAVKILLGGSVVCFPLFMALAWFYEITDKGIQLETDLKEIGARPLLVGNEIYFIIIGILLVALSISLYMNFKEREEVSEPTSPVSLLIADFRNQTGDAVFDGSVEQALAIGVEGASFVSSYSRSRAVKIAQQIGSGAALDEASARLVALREGIKLVLSGTIRSEGPGFVLELKALDPRGGEVVASAEANARDKSGVLGAVGELALQIREALGDVSLQDAGSLESETLSASSLGAVSDYSRAQALAHSGNNSEAVTYYAKAIQKDPKFGRAYSGWALSEYALGHLDKAEALWQKTLPLLSGMTDREKYRSMGSYYMYVSHNYDKAIENYRALVTQYPADEVGHNNLAVSYFMTRQFGKAMAEGKSIRDIYPTQITFRSNYALYAMYASDFATARKEAEGLIADGANYYKVYLPLAMAALEKADFDAAIKAYQSMAHVDARGASLSNIGLADLLLYRRQDDTALTLLETGIAMDRERGDNRNLAAKQIALVMALADADRAPEAVATANAVLDTARGLATRVPAALLLLELGAPEKSRSIRDDLVKELQIDARAYGDLITGALALDEGDAIAAVDALRASLQKSDLWVARLYLGQAYLAAGQAPEAQSEFEMCKRRLGEATALFLDDVPTFRYARGLDQLIEEATRQMEAPAKAGAG